MNKFAYAWVVGMLMAMPLVATAAQAIARDEPIEISSDKLDVFQNEHKAIFTGNVIAVQGTTTMRSKEMVVFYRDSNGDASAATSKPSAATAAPKPTVDAAAAVSTPAKPATPQGIYRIEAKGSVVFTTPTETALGDLAIYNVETDTIDLTGPNVTLTRGQNILKGTKLNYNMATSRSVLTGGVSASEKSGKPARVHGLFMPKSEDKSAVKP